MSIFPSGIPVNRIRNLHKFSESRLSKNHGKNLMENARMPPGMPRDVDKQGGYDFPEQTSKG